jgi:hypothetical protein
MCVKCGIACPVRRSRDGRKYHACRQQKCTFKWCIRSCVESTHTAAPARPEPPRAERRSPQMLPKRMFDAQISELDRLGALNQPLSTGANDWEPKETTLADWQDAWLGTSEHTYDIALPSYAKAQKTRILAKRYNYKHPKNKLYR